MWILHRRIITGYAAICTALLLLFSYGMVRTMDPSSALAEPDPLGLISYEAAALWREVNSFTQGLRLGALILGALAWVGAKQRLAAGVTRGRELSRLIALAPIIAGIGTAAAILALIAGQLAGLPSGGAGAVSVYTLIHLAQDFVLLSLWFLLGLAIVVSIDTFGGYALLIAAGSLVGLSWIGGIATWVLVRIDGQPASSFLTERAPTIFLSLIALFFLYALIRQALLRAKVGA